MNGLSLVTSRLKTGKVFQRAVSQVFSGRPIVITAALKQFTAALHRLYPGLEIDVLSATVHVPNWDGGHERNNLLPDRVGEAATHSTVPLFEIMIHSITGKAPLFFTPAHFLTDGEEKRLSVDMRDIEMLPRALPEVMIGAMQSALVQFWSEPFTENTRRWQWLSDLCKGALLISLSAGQGKLHLDKEQMLTLHQIAHCPEKDARVEAYGADCTEAWLLTYSSGQGALACTRFGADVLATRTVAGRQIVLAFGVAGRITAFDSLQAFADSRGVDYPMAAGQMLEVQPWAIPGDAFVAQAQAVLDDQLQRVAQMGEIVGADLAALERQYALISDTAALFVVPDQADLQPGLLDAALNQQPDWLAQATPDQLLSYSAYVLALAALQQASDGKAFDHDIDSASAFAKKALEGAMTHFGEVFNPDALLVSQRRYLADAPGVPTASVVIETDSLTQRALKNLGGLTHAATAFRNQDDTPLPGWVNEQTLRELITRADIGQGYPQSAARVAG